MRLKNVVAVYVLGFTLLACNDDDVRDLEPLIVGDYQSGILVSNEGPFSNGTGTVSFISDDLQTVENAIYNQVNGEDLGNIVQSIGFSDDKAYVVANNSNTIAVVDRFTFEKETIISAGLNNPRYFISVNGKGYVTNWGDTADETDDYVAILNLETNSVEGSIPVVLGPEEIIANGGGTKIYVAHQGAFGQNDQVSMIDTNTNEVLTISVGDVPNSMQFDASGDLWVLCGGKPSFTGEETAGALYKINTSTDTASKMNDFEITEHPNHLSRSGNDFYYALNGAVFKRSSSASTLSETSEFSALGIYAMVALDGRLYVTDAKDFASNGSLSIYDLNTKEEVRTLEVGLIPGGIYFN